MSPAKPISVTPDYWEEACKHLVKKDRVMKRLIPQFGDACLQSRGDPFITLARSIVGQQISVKAAQIKKWSEMDDETIIAELIAIRGIGRWTAEMFLIFHLLRPNVLPLDDVGLINGISKNYFSGESVSRSEAREVSAPWAPYRSVATWYIWRSLDPLPVDY